MDLPKFNETFIPILELLSDEKTIRHRELLKQVTIAFLQRIIANQTPFNQQVEQTAITHVTHNVGALDFKRSLVLSNL